MKMNTTGSYSYSGGKYWSYSTKLTETFKGYRFINLTRYSATTSKHQHDLKQRYCYDFILTQCDYGDWDIRKMIADEIKNNNRLILIELKKRTTKANRELKQAKIEKLQSDNQFLSNLLEGEEEENEIPIDEEFKAIWEQLSEKNKQHVRNGLGDNLLTSIEQARNVIGVMKAMLLFQNIGL